MNIRFINIFLIFLHRHSNKFENIFCRYFKKIEQSKERHQIYYVKRRYGFKLALVPTGENGNFWKVM